MPQIALVGLIAWGVGIEMALVTLLLDVSVSHPLPKEVVLGIMAGWLLVSVAGFVGAIKAFLDDSTRIRRQEEAEKH